MIEDYEENGRCSNCGRCCTDFLCMTRDEARRIARYLMEHPDTKAFQAVSEGGKLMASCPFRDPLAKRCSVYPARPSICRTFRCGMGDEVAKANFGRMSARDGATCFASLHWIFLGDPRLQDAIGLPRPSRADWLGMDPEKFDGGTRK